MSELPKMYIKTMYNLMYKYTLINLCAFKKKEGTILEKLEMKWYINSKHEKKEIIKSKGRNC